jgi:eukaryotic-like serine/threonine-protein kinase
MGHRESLAARATRRGRIVTPERWQRIKEVFQAAVELPSDNRDRYLAAETYGDSELRREVDKMLRNATGSGLLDGPAWEGLRLEGEFEAGMLLGPYEILQQVGVGGMGRVYKARDTRLGRTVAIKVLNAEFSDRLRTEGRAISALNHPHVCALYDIGDQEGAAYLVMEYIDGESLAACLARGALPFDEVLRYGAEIAGALAAAHAEGIVHCDLKPANIMITRSGAKVLDFGVAQMAQSEETSAGAVAGTAAYMSPSQLNGNPADGRSDIFALGLVLYEMASGKRPSRQALKPPANVPAGLAVLINGCLQPDAASRVQRMEDVRLALEQLRAATIRLPRARPIRTAVLLTTVAAAALLTWNLTRRDQRPSPVAPPAQSKSSGAGRATASVQPAPMASPHVVLAAHAVSPRPVAPHVLSTLASYPGIERDPAFSPDGVNIAFSWHSGARSGYGIYVRPVKDAGQPMKLTGGDAEDWGPAWSPDGRTIAFRRKAAKSGIYLVPASGGPADLLSPIAQQRQETLPQMSWSHDGKWIAAPDRDGSGATQIYLFPVGAGEKLTMTANTTGTDHAPTFSPDGKSLAYASCSAGVYPCDVYVIDLGKDYVSRARRRITEQGVYIRGIAWLPDGRSLVYSAGRTFSENTSLWRVSVKPPGIPEPIDIAGSRARHPAIARMGGLLAYTRLNGWNLMMIENFR